MNDTKDLVARLRQPSDFYSTDKMTAKRANALYMSLMQDAADALEAQDKLIADLDLVAKAAGISVVEFMRERDALKAELAVMRAQKPVAYITDTEQGPMVWTPEMYGEACTYCDDGEFPEPLCKVMP